MTTHTPISEEELDALSKQFSAQYWDDRKGYAVNDTKPNGDIVRHLIAEVRRLRGIINQVCYHDPDHPGFSEAANDRARRVVQEVNRKIKSS